MIAKIVVMMGGEPPSDRENKDVGYFYEDHFDDDVDYYDRDIEDDVEFEDEDVGDNVEVKDEDVEEDAEAEGEDYDEYPYGRPSDWSCITDASLN